MPASSEICKTPQGDRCGSLSRRSGQRSWPANPHHFWLTKRRIGRVPLGLRVRARDPKLFRQIVRMDLYAVSQGAIPVRLKELAQLKVAMMVGCPF